MNTQPGAHSKCQERDACTGPGCRKHSGKTAQKREKETKR